MILHIYTIIHTLISLVAIFTGFVVFFGMLTGERFDGWTKWFLITAVATRHHADNHCARRGRNQRSTGPDSSEQKAAGGNDAKIRAGQF